MRITLSHSVMFCKKLASRWFFSVWKVFFLGILQPRSFQQGLTKILPPVFSGSHAKHLFEHVLKVGLAGEVQIVADL